MYNACIVIGERDRDREKRSHSWATFCVFTDFAIRYSANDLSITKKSQLSFFY